MSGTPHTLVTTGPVPERALRAHPTLATRGLNYDPISFEAAEADPRWRVDRGRRWLTAERPGPPQPGGTFERAREHLRRYDIADPDLVRAVYDAAAPFDGRDMLLVGRFTVLRFLMGVRIGGVVDGPEELDGRPVHRFRWHYRTLQGHLERGQMDYDLRKWTDTGEVEFRIRAHSQRDPQTNPVVQFGFAVFGPGRQLRFYVQALERLRTMTTPGTVPRPAGGLRGEPVGAGLEAMDGSTSATS